MKINVLEPQIYNRISAGEVVERPASIVKELVENSIDAGAKNIRIEITEGGIKNVTVIDDGCGIEKEDLVTAFLPHATSKIKCVEDLDDIESLGFRGEALASISAVCQVRLSSKTAQSETGYSIRVDGGKFEKVNEISRVNGTTVSCDNLFFNTPVRAKFLRKPKTEEGEVTNVVEKFMLSHSDIAFKYYVDGKEVYNTTCCEMSDIIYTIYGNEVYENIVKLNYEKDGFKVSGYITKPKVSKSNRTYQTLFVNGRTVENYLISSAVQSEYETFLMKGRFPVYVINLTLPFDCVDVNVHPSKKEVKFDNPNSIYSLIRKAVEKALYSIDQIQNIINSTPEQPSEYEKIVEKTMPNYSSLGENEGRSYSEENNLSSLAKEVEIDSVVIEGKKNLLDEFKDISLKNGDDKDKFYFNQNAGFASEIIQEHKFLSASVKDEMKILGTIFKTYIVIEYDESLYFIDQHAAHERLLYDKLVKNVDGAVVAKQDLLVPYSFKLGVKEAGFVDALLDELFNLGFEIEKNDSEFTIKTIPYILSSISLEEFVDEIVKDSVDWGHKNSDFIHDKLCQSACKHAIKAGDSIDKDECAYIIEEVRKGVMLCPHGRPITLVMTKRDFEKLFKRVLWWKNKK